MARSSLLALGRDGLVALDRELARLGRGAGVERLRIGGALEALRARGWHRELGFPSLGAYALERAGQKPRWAADSCALARRLAALPVLRGALATGALGWSMVELLARRATPESEAELVERAMGATVRQMRSLFGGAEAGEGEGEGEGQSAPEAISAVAEGERCVLTVTVDRRDAWALDCTRWLYDHMSPGGGTDGFLHALLAEGLNSLAEIVPRGELGEVGARVERMAEAEAAWRAERRKWCDEAEARCEKKVELGSEAVAVEDEVELAAFVDPIALDAHVCRLSAELGARDLLLGALAERLWRADGWRLLGYASERQYAEERLGMSLSSVKAKRVLARRATGMPAVAAAVERRELGFEAALVVTRVATPLTIEAWLGRARERTVKHLREEVEWAEVRIRLGGSRDQGPPDDAALAELTRARLETGRLLAEASQMSVSVPFAKQALAVLSQMSVTPPLSRLPRGSAAYGSEVGLGRVKLRFHVSEDTRSLWRGFEECFAAVRGFLPARVTPVGFLCATFHLVWGRSLGSDGRWGPVHDRDGWECKNPVCDHKLGLTPHHLLQRSNGGGDEPENVASLCVDCHIHGVHEGRLRALPPASDIRWEIGRKPILVIQGRRKSELH